MSEVAATRPRKGLPRFTQFADERRQSKDMPAWKKAFIEGEKMYGQNLSRRGWSGKTWRGREFGPPETATGGNVFATELSAYENFPPKVQLIFSQFWQICSHVVSFCDHCINGENMLTFCMLSEKSQSIFRGYMTPFRGTGRHLG